MDIRLLDPNIEDMLVGSYMEEPYQGKSASHVDHARLHGEYRLDGVHLHDDQFDGDMALSIHSVRIHTPFLSPLAYEGPWISCHQS